MLTFFIILFRRLVDDSTMFETPEVKHPYTTIGTAADKDVDAVRAESDIKNFFIMRYQLSLCRKRWYVPNRTSGVDARGDD